VAAAPDAAAQIAEHSRGRGADVVIDLVGVDATLAPAAAVTRPLGLTVVGIAGVTLPVGFFSGAYEAAIATTYWGSLPELVEVIALAATGLLRAQVRRFGLDHALDAYRAMHDGTVEGLAVILPNT
jgi:propanol-preferring alcohol dehydrogenase